MKESINSASEKMEKMEKLEKMEKIVFLGVEFNSKILLRVKEFFCLFVIFTSNVPYLVA